MGSRTIKKFAPVDIQPPKARGRNGRPNSGGGSASHAEAAISSGLRPLRVLCVDDHVVLVEGLKARFAIDGGMQVVGCLTTAEGLAEAVERLRPDVVLLDIEMPGPDAFEMTDRVKRRHPEVRVIILSAHIRDAFISASFRVGISGYFAKSDELDDIVGGIYEVAGNKSDSFLLGPKVQERCRPVTVRRESHQRGSHEPTSEAPKMPPPTLLESLTAREAEVLRLIGKGLSRVQIAAQLCRSAKTINAHQGRMMKKLGIAARADLMRFAIREGLAQA